MGRIGKAYEVRFRSLLQQVRARRLEQGVQWLVAKAVRLSAGAAMPLTEAFTRVYDELADKPPFRKSQRSPTISGVMPVSAVSPDGCAPRATKPSGDRVSTTRSCSTRLATFRR